MNEMNHFRSPVDSSFPITIKPDEDGFTGRECPEPDCEGYFKVQFGTGLEGEGLPCHCPYCGHTAGHDQFWTKEQVEYIKSVLTREVTEALHKDLKAMEFNVKPQGPFGIGLSLTFKSEGLLPIHHYREKQLETEVVCVNCTLRYSVYGVFAFCPDCGQHNSLQIFEKSIEVVAKIVDLAEGIEEDVSKGLVENGLEDCVSVFDGFGRELCRIYAKAATNRTIAERISFQNLVGARRSLMDAFGIDLSCGIPADEWQSLVLAFQQRHLIAHRMGVVDQDYIAKSGDNEAVVGRRISITPDKVRNIIQLVGKVARVLSAAFAEVGKQNAGSEKGRDGGTIGTRAVSYREQP